MNAARSRMPSRGRAPSPAPRFNPFAAVTHATLYDQIGDSIGGDAADKLIADFGGRRFYIPRAPAPGDRITRSIGLRAALAMARTFGGDRIVIPVTSSHLRRRARILTMRADHVSISHIAHELRCTERYVYKVLALFRAPETQPASISKTSAPIAERLKRGHINQRS
jgi:Mor family transcriptional regulator